MFGIGRCYIAEYNKINWRLLFFLISEVEPFRSSFIYGLKQRDLVAKSETSYGPALENLMLHEINLCKAFDIEPTTEYVINEGWP